MVGIAQSVERLVVVQKVAGSSPVTHPVTRGVNVRPRIALGSRIHTSFLFLSFWALGHGFGDHGLAGREDRIHASLFFLQMGVQDSDASGYTVGRALGAPQIWLRWPL